MQKYFCKEQLALREEKNCDASLKKPTIKKNHFYYYEQINVSLLKLPIVYGNDNVLWLNDAGWMIAKKGWWFNKMWCILWPDNDGGTTFGHDLTETKLNVLF